MILCKVRTSISADCSCLAVTRPPYPSEIPSSRCSEFGEINTKQHGYEECWGALVTSIKGRSRSWKVQAIAFITWGHAVGEGLGLLLNPGAWVMFCSSQQFRGTAQAFQTAGWKWAGADSNIINQYLGGMACHRSGRLGKNRSPQDKPWLAGESALFVAYSLTAHGKNTHLQHSCSIYLISKNLSSKEVLKARVWLINVDFSSFLKPWMEAVTTEFSDSTNSNLI